MVKHIKAIALLWIAVSCTYKCYAQLPNTLGSLWTKVEKNYPGVKAKISAIEAAKLSERAVKTGMLPQIKAQVQNTYGSFEGSAGAFFPQSGLFNVSGSTKDIEGSSMVANSFGSATIEWELFSFGRLRKENEAANILINKSVNEKEAFILTLKKTLSERYITLLYSDAKLKWSNRNTDRLDNIRRITAGLAAAGLRPAADSLLASSSYVQSMGEHDKWEGYKDAAYIKLLELYQNDTIQYQFSAQRFIQPSQIGINRNAISPTHPVLEALNSQSKYYALSGIAQKRAALPSLKLLAGDAYRGTGIGTNGTVSGAWKDGFSNRTNNVLAGIGIIWNLTSIHTNRLKGESLFKEAEKTKLIQAQYEQAMQADLKASQSKIYKQYEQLEKMKLAVKQSMEAFDMYLARYKSGLIALSELLQIRTLLEQAESKQIEASREYWLLLAYQAELSADFVFLFNNL